MSLSLTTVQQKEFDALVKKESQSKGKLLMDTCRVRNSVIGNTVDFRKTGSVTANLGGFQQIVPIQDPQYNKVTATLQKYIVATAVDDIQRFLVNFDERREDAQLVAWAIGRRLDQIKIDALNASGTSNTISDGGTGLTFAKIRQVNEFFNDNAVAPEDRHIAISAAGEQDLFTNSQFTSIDFTNTKIVPTGSLDGNFVMGMNFHVIPTMDEGGLPKTGNIRTCFAWQRMALGLGMQRDISTSIDEIPREDIWQVKAKIFAGAITIDDEDIIKIDIDESV